MTLRWAKVAPKEWATDEQRDGVPDFTITRHGSLYRLKLRTSKMATLHDSLSEAKSYAQAIWG